MREIFFFKNHAENDGGRLFPDFFLFFKKAPDEVKISGLQLSFNTRFFFYKKMFYKKMSLENPKTLN